MLFLQTLVFQVMYRLHLLSIKTETSSFQKKKRRFRGLIFPLIPGLNKFMALGWIPSGSISSNPNQVRPRLRIMNHPDYDETNSTYT